MGNEQLVERRHRALGPAYSHFYREPLYIVRGEGVWLYDDDGRRYLDCYNNVPSVGHCRPEVIDALSRQAATLNTHTRYLHHAIVEYAEMLTATLPDNLSVCTLVCTGTEANDLAYRIARAVTGNDGAICTHGAYHGNSTLVSELSPGFTRKRRKPDFVADVRPPDVYRGPYGAEDPDYIDKYANLVDGAIEELADAGHKPGMMIIDSIYDAAGVHTPPPEYQQLVHEKVRAAGALVVCDEVQAGLTRMGDHWWGFMDSDVVPDIVTMGKPIGAGHPLAVVVTTPEIAAEFARESGYFNTFGGNPVSAAVGKTVLEIVEQDNLLDNVRSSGDYLRAGLRRLAHKHALIGDIRGKGLFLAVDLVRDRLTKEPAADEAAEIVESMREAGVLVALIGERRNAVKFRPPLIFATEHADIALAALDQALEKHQ
ncbi:MAG: aminotransferase class III-fold pyridoxal phosphate-dependent enzyme [Woeseiaceae bacterium]|nr:aminotransferase class III-fold pyridoxal phosphate-dependent enzyme [Woeseiaceae bacterium]